jgi:hypothetical protein
MKKLTTVLIAGLLLAGSLPVQAGSRDDYRDRHFQPDRHSRHFDQRPRHYRHGPAWGVLGAGLALGAIALTIEAPRPPVVVRPIGRPPGQMWYFCESAGAYYPYVNYCAEGWRAVPATPY